MSYHVKKVEEANRIAALFPQQFPRASRLVLDYAAQLERKYGERKKKKSPSTIQKSILSKLGDLYSNQSQAAQKRAEIGTSPSIGTLEAEIGTRIESPFIFFGD